MFLHLDDLSGNITVGFVMHSLYSFSVRSLDQTKSGVTFFIKPVSKSFASVFILTGKICDVHFGHMFGRDMIRSVMSVQVDWHG